jgi:shikimate dehydrogenase
MVISRDTKIYFSVSQSPTNFGATVYNSLLEQFGLDAVYIPRVAPNDAKCLVDAIRILNVNGCSVSMPLKMLVGNYLDYLSPDAASINAVNTIVNENGKLCGYNTDYVGIYQALLGKSISTALIYGSGGTCCSMTFALRELGVQQIFVTGRTEDNVRSIATKLGITYVGSIDEIIKSGKRFNLFANVTPASVHVNHDMCKLLDVSDLIFDVVLSKTETNLVAQAKKLNKTTIDGVTMYIFQVQRQFELYFGIKPEASEIKDILINNKLIT